jgi:hypothetical protein
MRFPILTITPEAKKTSNGKTRAFSAHLLGFLTADPLWEIGTSGNDSVLKPVWIAYCGSEREAHPFTANLRAGRKASNGNDAVVLPRSARFRWTAQKVPGGLVTVAYLPDLFHLEPVTPTGEAIRFVFAPPFWWIAAQAEDLRPDFGSDASAAARAALFCAFLDRRTPLPLVHDLRFHLQVYRAALASDWTHRMTEPCGRGGDGFMARGAEASGLDAPVGVSVETSALADFLIQQTSLYQQEEIRRGKTRVPAGGRLLPYSREAAAQLRLDFAVA